jgi:hypothetical protein
MMLQSLLVFPPRPLKICLGLRLLLLATQQQRQQRLHLLLAAWAMQHP